MAIRFQFSIRMLLAAMVAVAVAAAAGRAQSSFQSAFVINGLTVAFNTAAIVAVMQTRGKVRTFWVGTAAVLCPASYMAGSSSMGLFFLITSASPYSPQGFSDNRFFWLLWCAALVNGLFAVMFHCLFRGETLNRQ